MRGVRAASSCSIVTWKPLSASVSITTGTPPASVIASGYVVQYGAGQMTSSPGSHSAANAVYTACLPPLVTSTCDAVQSNPESRLVLAAIASFSSGRPPAGVYRWLRTSEQAAIAASTMCCGVGKSGSPAPNPMTFSPSACRALALASTARVADGAIAASRAEVRFTIGKPATAIPRSQRGSRVESRYVRVVGSFRARHALRRNTRRHGVTRLAVTRRDGIGGGNVATHAPCCGTVTTVDATAITIPTDLLPADGRFGCGPSKVRDEQVAALRRRAGHDPRHVAPQAGREEPRRRRPRQAHRPVPAPRRVGDRARQRRFHGVLGRRHVRPRPATAASTSCSASSPRSSPRPAPPRPTSASRRSSRPTPAPIRSPHAEDGIDLYALTHNETSTGVSMQLAAPRRNHRGRAALVVVDATSAAGGLDWDPAAGRRVLLRPAEVLRLRRRPLARGLLAGRRRAHPRRSARATAGARRRSTSSIALDNSIAEPDVQHAGARHARDARRPTRLDARQRRAVVGRRTQRHVGRHALRLGRGPRVGDAVRHRSRPPVQRRRHDRSRRRDRRRTRCATSCGRTASSTPTRTASSAATSCASACSRRSIRPTSRR